MREAVLKIINNKLLYYHILEWKRRREYTASDCDKKQERQCVCVPSHREEKLNKSMKLASRRKSNPMNPIVHSY